MPALPCLKPVFVWLKPLESWRAGRALVLVGVAFLWGCGSKEGGAGLGAGGVPPAPEVGVVTVALGDVGLATELPGRLEASRVAQVRARVAGVVQQRLFTEGSDVRAGQALFQIDAAPYQAAYDSVAASLQKAQANLAQARTLAERYQPLAEANAVSQQDYTNAKAAQQQAQADVAAATAALQSARINLGYASVTAPIAGRVGRALVTEGALVGQGEATPLAVVQQIDPIYINLTQSAGEVMALRQALANGRLKRAPERQAASVRVLLEDGSEYPRPARLLFSDLTVDATSGQVGLRAELPNPGGVLLPGLFVRVRLEQAQVGNALLLPQQAVTRTPQGDTVMVVSTQGQASARKVTLGGSRGNQWVVVDGLAAGEQVMVDGFQKLRGNAPVKAVPWVATAAAPTSAPTAPAPGTPTRPTAAATGAATRAASGAAATPKP